LRGGARPPRMTVRELELIGQMEAVMVESLEARGETGLSRDLIECVRDGLQDALSEATRRAYQSDWRLFTAWCQSRGTIALPAHRATVAAYLRHLEGQGRRVSTIGRALASISEGHKAGGHESPRSSVIVRKTLQAIRRRVGVAPRQKLPVLAEDLRRMVSALGSDLQGLRDRALLLVGFAGAFRRSELVSLDLGDVAFTHEGLEVTLRRSKTDQEAEGRKVGLPYGSTAKVCPVRALRVWLEAADITNGRVFRSVSRDAKVGAAASDRAVARAVKRAARLAGLDSAQFSGHSLRAGLATAAAKAGKSERAIMRQTGHRSVAMVRRYIREADLFNDNAAAGLL
jgi:integrase